MDQAAELRYYEILFIKTLSQFYGHAKLVKLNGFIELACFISDADTTQVMLAAERVLTNDVEIRILKDEYIMCLKLFSGMNDSEIKQHVKCSPATLARAVRTYKDGSLYISPKFNLTQTNNIFKMLKTFRDLGHIC